MAILLKLILSFGLGFSLIFALLPGSFGLINFRRSHSKTAGQLARVFFHALWLLHIPVIYNVWAGVVGLWWPILLLLGLVVTFFATIGQDLGACSRE